MQLYLRNDTLRGKATSDEARMGKGRNRGASKMKKAPMLSGIFLFRIREYTWKGRRGEANKLKDSSLLYVLPLEVEEWNYNYLHTDCFISTFIREFCSSPLHLSRSTYLPAGQMYFIKCNDLIQSTWPWVAYNYYPYMLLTWHKLDELRWTVLFPKELVLSL